MAPGIAMRRRAGVAVPRWRRWT